MINVETVVLFGHLLVAFLITGLVLLQRGKGAEAGTGFGAGASGTVFGARGSASFFSRATAVLATLFFATSLALAYFSTQSREPESIVEDPGLSGEVEVVEGAAGEVPERLDSGVLESLEGFDDLLNTVPEAPEGASE